MQKITPFLWFDAQAEGAVAFYLSVFKDGKIMATTHYPENGPRPEGTVMTIAFELQGDESQFLTATVKNSRWVGPHRTRSRCLCS